MAQADVVRLNDYVLVSQSRTDIIIWQWIGYERFFIPGKFGTVCADAQMTDFHRSRMYSAPPTCFFLPSTLVPSPAQALKQHLHRVRFVLPFISFRPLLFCRVGLLTLS